MDDFIITDGPTLPVLQHAVEHKKEVTFNVTNGKQSDTITGVPSDLTDLGLDQVDGRQYFSLLIKGKKGEGKLHYSAEKMIH